MSKQFEHFDGWGHGALCLYVDKIESLAREAGAALARLEDTVADMIIEGMEISGEVDSARGYAVAILTKLDAAGLLPGKEG